MPAISISLSPEAYEKLGGLAKEWGMSISKTVERLVLSASIKKGKQKGD